MKIFIFISLSESSLLSCYQLDNPADVSRADVFASPEAAEPLALPAWMFWFPPLWPQPCSHIPAGVNSSRTHRELLPWPPPSHTAGKHVAAPAHCGNTSTAEEEQSNHFWAVSRVKVLLLPQIQSYYYWRLSQQCLGLCYCSVAEGINQ